MKTLIKNFLVLSVLMVTVYTFSSCEKNDPVVEPETCSLSPIPADYMYLWYRDDGIGYLPTLNLTNPNVAKYYTGWFKDSTYEEYFGVNDATGDLIVFFAEQQYNYFVKNCEYPELTVFGLYSPTLSEDKLTWYAYTSTSENLILHRKEYYNK